MNLQKIIMPILGVVLVAAAWRAYGWAGVAVAATGIVMWALLHSARLMRVPDRAAQRPKRLRGQRRDAQCQAPTGCQPAARDRHDRGFGRAGFAQGRAAEIYRWTDGTNSHVTASCERETGEWDRFPPAVPGRGA